MIEEQGTYQFNPEFQKMVRLPLSGPKFIIVDKDVPDEKAIKEWEEGFLKEPLKYLTR